MAVDIVVKANGKAEDTRVTIKKFKITFLYLTGFVKTPVTADTTSIKANREVPIT